MPVPNDGAAFSAGVPAVPGGVAYSRIQVS
jgi:hypothetical protein